ncbi:MAG: hypothetical protein V4724_36335 [Pseudomonadota bacterium]
MKKLIATVVFPLVLAGCAGFGGTPPVPGERMEAVKAKLGQPTATYSAGTETILEYATGPFGQYTWMARFGTDGALQSYEQVLTDAKFATIRIGSDDKETILRTFGRPAEKSYLALRDMQVWSYRYKQSGVWDSMMHVHFDRNGIVRELMAGPDPDKEEKRGFFR